MPNLMMASDMVIQPMTYIFDLGFTSQVHCELEHWSQWIYEFLIISS